MTQLDLHTRMMHFAMEEAAKAEKVGEVPVGAVLYTVDGTVVAAAHNEVEQRKDPTAHAEFLACKKVSEERGDKFLEDCYVAVTLEPCAMCAQALSYFRVKEIRFGAYDVKSGGTVNGARVLNYAHHKPRTIGGLCEDACKKQLTQFFEGKR